MLPDFSPSLLLNLLPLYTGKKVKKQMFSCVHVCAQMHICVDVYAYSGRKTTPTHTCKSSPWSLKAAKLTSVHAFLAGVHLWRPASVLESSRVPSAFLVGSDSPSVVVLAG